jgi:hypothetical protein
MNPRGHRGIAAVLMLLALVLSAMALLPARAQASSAQITGLVSQCGSGTTFIGGAQVTLSDANGMLPSLSTTTAVDGTFAFTPPSSNYTIAVTKSGYYSNNTPLPPTPSPFRFDGSSTITVDTCLDAQPASPGVVTFTVVNGANPTQKIGGATISAYNPARLPTPYSALVFTNTTNATTGVSVEHLWNASFEVRVTASGYLPFIQTMGITAPSSIQISMTAGVSVVGHARNAAGQFVSAGLTGWLYSPSTPKYSGTKAIPAVVSGSLFSFSAPAGTYQMIVDANGYTAYDQPITVTSGTLSQDVTLQTSPQERYQTTVQFGTRDWNNFTVYRNLTLNPDTTLPGLGPAGLRDLRQQINFTLGNGQGSGTASVEDQAAFQAWIAQNGPLYVTTDSFLLVNGKSFDSSITSYSVSVSNTLTTPGAKVWINTSATYRLKSTASITYGQPKYFLNMTVYPDTNTTVYHNETYIVELPAAYEMASDTILPNPSAITTQGYTHITVDPGLTGQAIQMVIEKSTVGIARAKVVGPSGKFYVVNSAYQNYQAFVANNTNISFSAAETSNPPSNDSTRDNFTWRFLANGSSIPNPSNNVRYGIQPSFVFPLAGPYVVNLTAIGAGGNVSYRNISVWVDGQTPAADFKTNVTGAGSAIGMTLHINQDTIVRFDGSLSSDLAFTGKTGIIPNSGYAWDFNGDRITDTTGRIVNGTFDKPGQFTVNLTVADAVGWKGANATMTVIVNDTQAPVPGFTILDPTNDYAPVSTLTELQTYTFNASTTTDNYDKLSALNFTWTIPGPLIGMTGTSRPLWGVNITFGWSEWNLSYPVVLTVRDTGFGSGKWNNGTLTKNISVQVDPAIHPDLALVVGTVKIDNANPESGQTITITVNVTNKAGHSVASQIYVTVTEGTGSQPTLLSPTWSLTDKNGNPLSNLTSGATGTLKISVAVVGQGNKTLSILVADHKEPYVWVTSENRATEAIIVNQPAWVNYAIIGSVVAVFAVVIFAMYYRRKVKAGDWEPRFRRAKGGKDEGGKEKPKKEKEAKEEKKRL